MKIAKRILAILMAITLIGTCGICAMAAEEVTTVSLDSVYLATSSAKALSVPADPTTLATKYKNRYYLVYRLSDEQLAKLAEAKSVTLDVTFAKNTGYTYYASLINQDIEEALFTLSNAWSAAATNTTATIDDTTKTASFDVKEVMQNSSQTDNLFIFKLFLANSSESTQNNVVTSAANPVLKIVTEAATSALTDIKALEVPASVTDNFTLPVIGANGSAITWTSDNDAIVIDAEGNAVVTRPGNNEEDVVVNLTATAVSGEDTASATFAVTVIKSQVVDSETIIMNPTLATYVTKNYDSYYNEVGYLYMNGTGRQNFVQFKAENNEVLKNAAYATVNFYVESASGTPSIILYGLSGADKTSWVEAMNYNDANAKGLVSAGEHIATASSGYVVAGQWVRINITEYLNAQEDDYVAFRLYGGSKAQLATRGEENAPYIEILSGDKAAVALDRDALNINGIFAENKALPATGANGSTITWTSNSGAIVIENGNAIVNRAESDVECVLTATITKGDDTATKQFEVVVPAVLVSLVQNNTAEENSVTVSLYDGYVLGENQIFTVFYNEAGDMISARSGVGTFALTSDVKTVKAMLWKLSSIMPVEMQTLSPAAQVTE